MGTSWKQVQGAAVLEQRSACTHLVKCADSRGQATMHAEDAIVNERRQAVTGTGTMSACVATQPNSTHHEADGRQQTARCCKPLIWELSRA